MAVSSTMSSRKPMMRVRSRVGNEERHGEYFVASTRSFCRLISYCGVAVASLPTSFRFVVGIEVLGVGSKFIA